MAQRRALAAAAVSSHRGFLGWTLWAGSGLVSGLRSNGATGRWARSLLWAVAAPALIALMRRGSDSILGKLANVVLPSRPSKTPVRK
ncbi:MAG: hypothetical protein A2992_02765 [Elusimicrobia bacterium RIFCSPLOWO2_01_FULL_59_12]|nr:MAG: hypothetical protein A2992_02765 [Elusimicrobia bacterium RIFCSPLOWO2_01_FULL_59_12]